MQSATTSDLSLEQKLTPGSEEPGLLEELQKQRLKEVQGELQYLHDLPDAYQLAPSELALVRQLQRSAQAELLLRLKGSQTQTSQSAAAEGAPQDTSTKTEATLPKTSAPQKTSSTPSASPPPTTRISGTRRTRR